MAASDPLDFSDRYNTKLSPQQEAEFQKWAQSLGRQGSSYDYDLRGAFASGAAQSANGHFPDTFKKPNHPTFSDQSKYSGVDGFQGGAWARQPDGTWSFAPSPSTLKMHDRSDLESYFQKVEPGNKLVISDQQPAGSATREQLYTALRNADKAGDNAGAAKLAAYIQSLPAEKPATAAPATEPPKTGFQHAADLAGVVARHPLTSFVGLGENALSSVTGGAGSLVDAITGSDPGVHDLAYRPRTEAGKEIANLGSAESAKIGEKYDKYAGTGPLAQTIKERLPEAMGAVGTITALSALRGAGKVPGNAGPRPPSVLPPDVAGEAGAAGPEAAAAAGRSTRLAPVSAEAPSKATLKASARALYKQAEDAGAVVSEDSFAKAKGGITADLQKQGLDSTLHPDTTAALKRLNEEQGPVTLEKLETLRRIAQDAEDAQRPADKRLAGELVDSIDEFAEKLDAKDFVAGASAGPEAVDALKQARNYWSRARKADTLDELVRRAELSAPNFSGSGMENALRTEFRALAKNERRMRLFTAEEQAAIEKVAKGGPTENALRMLGKFAPTGVVSAILSGGAGAALGGGVGAVALPVVGGISRLAAKNMTMNNVARANQLVRRGPRSALTPQQALSKALAEQRQ